MAQADTQVYYRSMLPQIEAGAAPGVVVPGAPARVVRCSTSLGGSDDTYASRCPSPWLVIQATPTADSAQLIFARGYYDWARAYVAAALRAQPAAHASAEARVVWALDVWAHVQYALWALNLCWSDWPASRLPLTGLAPAKLHIPGVPTTGLYRVVETLAGDLRDFYASLEQERGRFASTGPGQFVGQGSAKVPTVVAPAPFMTHSVFWTFAAPGVNNKRPNPLWGALLAAIQPWSSAWGQHWLGSKDRKDAPELRQYAGDAVMTRALMQWRLWSARDAFPYWGSSARALDVNAGFWPQGMGQGDNCVTLSQYIRNVEGERGRFNMGAYAKPTFATAFDGGIRRLAYSLARLPSYDEIVTEQAATWASSATPRLNPDGTPMTVDQYRVALGLSPDRSDPAHGARPAAQPVTAVDYGDILEGLRELVTARARVAVQNPELLCAPNDSMCLEAAKQTAKFQKTAKKIPVFGDLMKGMRGVADWMVATVGAAVGNVYLPFYVLRNPFARTLSAQGFDMAATGSTASVFARVSIAALNTGRLAYVGAPAPAVVAAVRPQFVDDTCIANCPEPPGGGSVADPAACDASWQSLAAARAMPGFACLEGNLTGAQYIYMILCNQRQTGALTSAQAQAHWTRYVREICAQTGGKFEMPSALPPMSVWDGFARGVLSAGTLGHWLPELFVRR